MNATNKDKLIIRTKKVVRDYLDSNLVDICLDGWTECYCDETGADDISDKEYNDMRRKFDMVLPEILKLFD